MNGQWSANLANNFGTKIQSAGSAFTMLKALLQGGAESARLSAETFQSVDDSLQMSFFEDPYSRDAIVNPNGIPTIDEVINNTDKKQMEDEIEAKKQEERDWIEWAKKNILNDDLIRKMKKYGIDPDEVLRMIYEGNADGLSDMEILQNIRENWIGGNLIADRIESIVNSIFDSEKLNIELSEIADRYREEIKTQLQNGNIKGAAKAIEGWFKEAYGKKNDGIKIIAQLILGKTYGSSGKAKNDAVEEVGKELIKASKNKNKK